MSKPWDKLRIPPQESPIREGTWSTCEGIRIYIGVMSDDRGPGAEISFGSAHAECYYFPDELRELAEFCNELADQLDGK